MSNPIFNFKTIDPSVTLFPNSFDKQVDGVTRTVAYVSFNGRKNAFLPNGGKRILQMVLNAHERDQKDPADIVNELVDCAKRAYKLTIQEVVTPCTLPKKGWSFYTEVGGEKHDKTLDMARKAGAEDVWHADVTGEGWAKAEDVAGFILATKAPPRNGAPPRKGAPPRNGAPQRASQAAEAVAEEVATRYYVSKEGGGYGPSRAVQEATERADGSLTFRKAANSAGLSWCEAGQWEVK